MAIVLGKIAYTQYTRRRKTELDFASTSAYDEVSPFNDIGIAKGPATTVTSDFTSEQTHSTVSKEAIVAEEELLSEAASNITSLSSGRDADRIAIFPQYIVDDPTTLIIRESSIPRFSGSFTVYDSTDRDKALFHAAREIPSLHRKHALIDARTNARLMTVSLALGTLPRSFVFEDPAGTKVLDLQGDFFVPFTGAKSRAIFRNAAANGGKRAETVELAMHGSYRNRHAVITEKASGQIVATIRCNLWDKRFIAGGRRTYVASIRAGVDMAVIVGMITALDTRND